MKRWILAGLLVGWLLGAASMGAYVEVTGGWYEYQIVVLSQNVFTMVNQQGWQPLPNELATSGIQYLRRPRIRLGR